MEAYLYKYKCPGIWYGNYEGVRNIFTSNIIDDTKAVAMAKGDLKKTSDFKDCAVTLLVKYKLSIESIKTYPEITKMPFSETHNTVTLSLD